MSIVLQQPASHRLDAGTTPARKTIRLRGAPVDVLTEHDCIQCVLTALDGRRGGWIITANLDHLRRQQLDPDYRTTLNEADLVVADGMPLVWASRLQRTPLPQRIAGSELFLTLTAAAARHNRSIFLLGGNPGTAKLAAHELGRMFPEVEVAGINCPPFGFENDEDLMNDIIDSLVRAQPDIVYVALGSPKQEKLIREIRHHLPNAWWIGVGISFSFLAGDARRAPRWVQTVGMEWLHRLAQEPRRLGKRYLLHGIPYALGLLATSALRGVFSHPK